MPAALIREAALLYATTKPAAMMPSSTPVVHHTNGVQNQRAAAALVGLTGNFDIPGGNVVAAAQLAGGRRRRLHHPRARVQDAAHVERPAARAWARERFPVWTEMIDQGQAMDIPRQINTGEPYPLRGLVGFGMNYRMFPDSNGWLDALEKLDFVCDDRPLPHRHRQVRRHRAAGLHARWSGARCAAIRRSTSSYTQPVIEPVGESRSDTDIIFGLAQKLGLDYQTYDAEHDRGDELGGFLPERRPGLRRRLRRGPGLDPRAQRHDDGRAQEASRRHAGAEPPARRLQEVREERLPHARAARWSSSRRILEKYSDRPGIDGLPVYNEPKLSPVSTPDVAADYPLVLGTGTRLPMFIHSRTFRLPWTRSLRRDAMVDLNPADAARYGIAQGDTRRAVHAQRRPSR